MPGTPHTIALGVLLSLLLGCATVLKSSSSEVQCAVSAYQECAEIAMKTLQEGCENYAYARCIETTSRLHASP
jgi:hypothetical protein